MSIFYSKTADAWATKKIDKSFNMYAIETADFEKLKTEELKINPNKTTKDKLVFYTEAGLKKFKQALEERKKAVQWGAEIALYIKQPDVWFTLDREWRLDLTELFLLVKENKEFPKFSTLNAMNPDLFAYIQELIESEILPSPPESLTQ